MKWLKRLFGPSAYNQGHFDGFKEGFTEGQDWGHAHGACEHTHPFEDMKQVAVSRGSGWGTYNPPQASTKGR